MEKGLELHVKGKFDVPGMSVQGLGFRVFERPFFLRVCGLGFVVTSLLLKGVTLALSKRFQRRKLMCKRETEVLYLARRN